MKIKLIPILIISIALAACTPGLTPALSAYPAPTEAPIHPPTAASTLTPKPTFVMVTPTPAEIDGFKEFDPGNWARLSPAVLEYLYYRKKAVLTGDVGVLWAQYPDLREDVNIIEGVNREEFFVNNMQGLNFFDGNILPDAYERMRFKMIDKTMMVRMHGLELYLFTNESGQFQESGGEFLLILYLRVQNGRWTVYKTHDISGP
jgi:hypothetical protein